MPWKIAITSWAISADLFAFTNNIKTIITTVHNIPEDYHYVEAWFIGSENWKCFFIFVGEFNLKFK